MTILKRAVKHISKIPKPLGRNAVLKIADLLLLNVYPFT